MTASAITTAKGSVTFLVPLGVAADGGLVRPEAATKGQPYGCPGCGDPLVFRAGEVRARHFAHRATGICTSETVLHATAKRLVAESVALWRAGRRESLVTVRRCANCERSFNRPIPASVTHAAVERRLASGRVVDVALLGADDGVIGAVEVFVAHAVDETKAVDLGSLPWVEVAAEQIVNTPFHWGVIAGGSEALAVCPDCVGAKARRWRRLLELAVEFAVEIPSRPYWSEPYTCPGCGEDTIITTWSGQSMLRKSSRPPDPWPAWLVYVRRENEVWNRCLRCEHAIDRWPLYDYGGIFFNDPDAAR